MKKRKTAAIVTAVAAVVAAFATLWATGFAFVHLLRGPAAVTEGAELKGGAYVSADLRYIMDVCGVERTETDGVPVAYFAVAPVGNQFVMIRFPAASYDDFAALEAETGRYLLGEIQSTSFHIGVSGTVKRADESVMILLEKWFDGVDDWMSQSGVINAVDDYNVYLSSYIIDAGMVGSLSQTWALILTGLALAFLLYAVCMFIRVGMGAYDKKAGKKRNKKPSGATPAPAPAPPPSPVPGPVPGLAPRHEADAREEGRHE